MQNICVKKKKTKSKTAKLIANQYLNNICLNDSINEEIFNDDKSENNKYKIFLYLNTIKSNKSEQTDYFNCYKEKLRAENARKNKVLDFLKKEFLVSENKSLENKNEDLKHIDSTEAEYFEAIQRENDQAKATYKRQRNLHTSNTLVSFQQKSTNSTLTKYSLVNELVFLIFNSIDFRQSKVDIDDYRLNIPQAYQQRTISESSSESHSLKINKIIQLKKSSQNILDKLTNEK